MTVEVPQIQLLDDDMVGYRLAWCLVRQWIHGLRQLLGFSMFSTHFGNWTLLLCPRMFQPFSVFGCCLWSTAYLGRVRHLALQWIHVLREALDEFHIFSTVR